MISSPSTSVIIATFLFSFLALLKAKGSIAFIFSFFLRNFLKAFLALRFSGELIIKISTKDVDPLNLKSSFLTLGTLPLNRYKLPNIFTFKPLTFVKGNSKGTKVTSFSADSSSLVLMVKANTKSL
jgi:hypothetical protein